MTIDNITIIISITILLLTALSVIASPFFRPIKEREDDIVGDNGDRMALPPITIVVLAHNNPEALDKHLPLILTQDYEPGYEVVVVGEKGNMDVEAVLNRFANNSRLYATYVPSRSLFMSKPKLAASLGIKAAHNEWIVMLNSTCRPSSDTWLKGIAKHMRGDTNLVVGYDNYEEDAPSYYRFIRLREACYYLRKAAGTMAYRSSGGNIAFKRSEFIKDDGYRGNLQHVHGEYDFIVNKYAKPSSASIALQPDTFVHDDNPSRKSWNERCIANSHVGAHLERHTSMKATYITDATLMYLSYAATMGGITFGCLRQNYIILAMSIVCLLAEIGLRIWMVKKKCEQFEEHFSAWGIPFYELSLVWFDIMTRLRYAKADKHDFSTHKI